MTGWRSSVKVGDLLEDLSDGELGLVISGPHADDDQVIKGLDLTIPGLQGYFKVAWPCVPQLCDLAASSVAAGIVRVVNPA